MIRLGQKLQEQRGSGQRQRVHAYMGSSGSPTVLGADWWLALRTPARGKSDVVGPKPRTLQVRLRSAGTAATPLHGLRRSANLLARWRSLWSAWSAEISHRLCLCCPRYLYVQHEGGPEMAVIRFGWPPACVACKTLVRSAEQYQAPSDILGKAQRGAPCSTRMPRGLRVGRLSVGPPHLLHRAIILHLLANVINSQARSMPELANRRAGSTSYNVGGDALHGRV